MSLARYKLVFFSPISSTRGILDHLFKAFPAHVGKIGHYEHCAFLTRGTGQFLATADANPTIGTPGTLERVEEDRVEVLVVECVREVVAALKDVHPYEEVAYDVYKLEDY
ncbi:GTP cyclohydrolase 1 type 2/Nif3 [Mycena sanguinolenta]|nr:GTP cyclohydrolase 1 type 2/Nif3 [Mycena sanguinolenta]